MRLEFDPDEAIATLTKADPRLGRLMRRAGPFSLQPRPLENPFDSLLRAIVNQQLSGKAAATIHARAVAAFGRGQRIAPQALLAAKHEALRGVGLSNAKALAVKDLAAKTLDGTVPRLAALRRMSDDEIVERLTAVRGIGVWSVEMLLMFHMGRPDVLPVADLGVRKGFMLTYGERAMPTPTRLRDYGERWRPYRSVAAWYLWRAVDLAARPKKSRERRD